MNSRPPWLLGELERLSGQRLRRRRRVTTSLAGGACLIDNRTLCNFSSNDYLALAHDPRVVAAATRAMATHGVGAGASALVSGRTELHAALEERLARFENQPAALLFPTGFAANVGTICALVGNDDIIFSDRLNHASLIDGCRLSGARIEIFEHRDLAGLEQRLRGGQQRRRRLIVTDGVFSMDGDLAPLREICDLAERYDAMLLVDEAHATGVLGAFGRGACELAGVEERVTARVGTLSKALGAAGGFVTGSRELIDWLWNTARTQIFSTALPAAVCAAACAALEIVATEPDRRQHLLHLTAHFRGLLAQNGFPVDRDAIAPIVPVILHSEERALRIAGQLEEGGYLVGAIRPPSVPKGTSRLRISLSSAHSIEDVERLAALLASLARIDTSSTNDL